MPELQPIVPLPQTAPSHAGPAPIPSLHPEALPPVAGAAVAPPPTATQQVGTAPSAPPPGRKPRPLPLEDPPPAWLVQPRGPQSPAILLSPPVPRSFTPVPACVAGGDVFAPSAFELLPPPARRTSRMCSTMRSLSANDLRSVGTEPEEGRRGRGGGASFDVGRLEAALLGREMEQLFRASGQRIMAEGVTTIASVRGGSLVRSTFSARPNGEAAAMAAASRKLSVPDPPPPSAPPLARPASCHQLSSVAAAAANGIISPPAGGAAAKEELAGQVSLHDIDYSQTLPQHHMGTSSQLYDDLRGDSASALDSASEASDLTDSSASAREKARKKVSRRRRGQPDRWPRLLVLSVEAGTVVECQLESSKGKTVTFKFDIHDMFPRDIANNLVVTNLLAEQHADVFVEQVQDIVQQLKEHPDRLPTVSHHLAVSDGRLSFENMEGGSVMVMPGRLEKESSEPPGSSHGSPVRQVKPLPTQLHQSATSRQLPSPIDEQLPPLPAPHAAPAAASVSASHSVPATPTATASPVPIAVVQPPTPVSKSATSQAAGAAAGAANQVTAEAAADSSSSSSRLASPSATGDERLPLASAASAQPPHAAGSAAGLATSGLAVSVLPAVVAVASAPAPVPTVDMRQLQAPLESGGSQAPTPPTYGTTPHALSSENSFSESEPGSSAMPPQAYGIVTDLSHLQQRLVELTTTSGGPTHATVTVPAATLAAGAATADSSAASTPVAALPVVPVVAGTCALPPATVEHAVAVPPLPETPSTPTPPSPKQPVTSAPLAPVTVAAVLVTAVAVTTTTATTSVAGSSSRPSSVPPEPRKPAVATNLEDLKLELQKLHGNTMKSNIEQGLQAIFSQNAVSSAQPLTPAHSQPQVLPVLTFPEHPPCPAGASHSLGAVLHQVPLASTGSIAVQVVPATPVVTAHSAGQVSAEGGTHIPLAGIAVPCGNLPAPAPVVPVPAVHEPVATRGSPDGVPGAAMPAAPQGGNRFSRFHVTPVRDDPLLSNPSSPSSSSSTTTQSTPTSSSNTVVPPTPPPDAPAPPAPPTLATTATSPIPLSPDAGRGSNAEVSRGGGGGCVVSTATQTSSTEVKASPPVNCGRFKVTTVVDELAAKPPISAVTPMPSVAEDLELKQEQLAPPPFPPGATSQNVREPPPHSMMRGRSATLHSGGGEATPYCGAAAAAASHQDDAADPYATFPYADPRKQRTEPSSLELALAKIMRGYLRASSDDLSSLSQTSLDSEPLRVRVHVRDAEAQTERASTRNACVSTTTLPPSTPSRRFLASLEPPTLSKARSLSSLSPSLSPSLSHWREETSAGCERCASPSPPCLSPCGSPPTRRGHPRPGSSNLVDWGRSLSLSQFLSALTTEQRQELEVEESEDAEEFLKQLLARQQREREELENRHRRELELVRQRLRNAGGSPAWALCETTANGGSPPQRAVPHSQSVPHFPRTPPPEWHAPPPTEPLRINLHRSTSEGPDPGAVGRPVYRTRTLTDDLLRLVQLNGAARTCPGPASPEGKPTLHQLMQQRSLREGATSPAGPLTPPPTVFPPLAPSPVMFPPLTPPSAVFPPISPPPGGYPAPVGYPSPSGSQFSSTVVLPVVASQFSFAGLNFLDASRRKFSSASGTTQEQLRMPMARSSGLPRRGEDSSKMRRCEGTLGSKQRTPQDFSPAPKVRPTRLFHATRAGPALLRSAAYPRRLRKESAGEDRRLPFQRVVGPSGH
ncbi:hypothetical protein ISCGN_024281 [Ixodes scapularis]